MSIRSLTHRPITLLARTTTRSFWAIGLSLMFLAPAPVPITPEMQARYERKMDVVSDYLGDVVRTNREAHVLETELRSALGWSGGWLNGYDREEVAKIRAKLKPLRAEKRRVESKHFELEADAKSELGIWSEAGVSEAKDLFWNTARRGKQAATRGVLWDLFFEMFRADNYEDQINFLLRIVWIIVSNVFIFVFVSTITFLLEAIRVSEPVSVGAAPPFLPPSFPPSLPPSRSPPPCIHASILLSRILLRRALCSSD